MAGTDDAKPAPEAANDDTWAASRLEWLPLKLADGAKRLAELAKLVGRLQAGRLAACWAESTCWTVSAARKAGDMGETTDVEDEAVEATLGSDGGDTDSGGISSDSCTKDKASYAADWLLRVFLVFIVVLVSKSAKIRKEEQLIRNDQQAATHQKSNVTQRPCKSPKGPPRRSRAVRGETAGIISLSPT